MLGFILIILGVVFLLKNLGLMSAGAWEVIWPAILILLGLGILFKKKRGEGFFWEERFGWRKRSVDEE